MQINSVSNINSTNITPRLKHNYTDKEIKHKVLYHKIERGASVLAALALAGYGVMVSEKPQHIKTDNSKISLNSETLAKAENIVNEINKNKFTFNKSIKLSENSTLTKLETKGPYTKKFLFKAEDTRLILTIDNNVTNISGNISGEDIDYTITDTCKDKQTGAAIVFALMSGAWALRSNKLINELKNQLEKRKQIS